MSQSEKTVREILDAFYLSSDFLSGKPLTQSHKRYELERFCATEWGYGITYGILPICGLTFKDVDQIIVQKIDRPAACRAFVKCLRALIKFAQKTGIEVSDPAIGVVLPPVNPLGLRAWTEEEIAIFEAAYPLGTKERLAFTLALYTGLRRQDLQIIGPRHVQNGVIYISPEKTKMITGASVVLPVHPELAKVLALVPEGQKAFLMTSWGRPFSLVYLTIWFGRAVRAAGLPMGLCLHGLRKAACRRLAEAGCTVHEIMAVSGHRSTYHVERYTMSVSWEKLARRAMNNLVQAFPAAQAA